jgi:hypothetical protein
VQFGTIAATSFSVMSATTIYAVAPAESAATIDVKVTTPTGTSATGAADQYTFVADQALSTVSSPSISVGAGVSWLGTVASFSDADSGATASQFTAITSWGDGQYSNSSVALVGSNFNVNDGHTYAAAGTYTVIVGIWDVGGSSLTISGTATVTPGLVAAVRPAPKGTGTKATATHGVAFSGNVASFLGSIGGGTASNYTASINWGDGHTTTGIIRSTGNNNFSVSGANTYATAGVYTVKITITDSNGASTTVTTTITVSDARQYRDDDDGAPAITDDPWRGDLGTVLAVAEDDTTDGADGDARISALDELFTSPVAMGDAVLASL